MTSAPAFLGIEKSVKGRRWVDRMSPAQSQVAIDISQKLGLPDTLARVLAGRGVTAAEAEAFLDPTLKA
jgi:single-stranded-DNA-specific exonuclease